MMGRQDNLGFRADPETPSTSLLHGSGQGFVPLASAFTYKIGIIKYLSPMIVMMDDELICLNTPGRLVKC